MTKRTWHTLPWLLLAGALGLAGCASRPVSAPVVSLAPPARSTAPRITPGPGQAGVPQGFYAVQPGDTLYSIALNHGVDYHDVARWNGIKDPSSIRPGQLLRVAPPQTQQTQQTPQTQQVQVGAARGVGAVQARSLGGGTPGVAPLAPQGAAAGGVVSSPKAQRLPYTPQNLALLSKSASQPAAPQSRAPAAPQAGASAPPAPKSPPPRAPHAAGVPDFVWPAQGKLLDKFSPPTNKGIDIGDKLGAPVLAAAPGRVMYTGSGIHGYGKLIVIKHDDGYNSVYAHNKVILVKEGQAVAQGQQIGEVGETESKVPMLHFEIRKSGKPVNPLEFLPAHG